MDQARLRPAQVGASTAAAVGGAFLASRLGVYGTIIGVGVITLMSTVGGEMLLRSLEHTKQAARTANLRQRTTRTVFSAGATRAIKLTDAIADAATEEQPMTANTADPLDEAATTEQPLTAALSADTLEAAATTEQPATATLPDLPVVSDHQPPVPDDQPSKARRWPLVAGGFIASFGLALAVIVGIETFTGQSLNGDGNPTVVNVFRGAGQSVNDPAPVPATPTDESTTTQEGGATSSSDPQDDAQPDPAAPEGPAPAGAEQGTQPGEQTPPPDDEVTPSPDETTSPPDDEEPPPSDEEETPTPGQQTPAP
jgi:hypothetical protein